MATVNPDLSDEGVLNIGDNVIYTCPYNYVATILSIRLDNPSAYNITLRVERKSPASTFNHYTFTLDAGDYFSDSTGYALKSGDKLIINVDAADTYYSITGRVFPANLQKAP